MNTLEFTVLNHQYWQYMFHITGFWYSPNRSSMVLQDRAIKRSGTPETPNAIQNLKISLLTERCFHTDCHPAQYCAGAAAHTTQIWCKLSWHNSQAHSFLHHRHQLAHPLASSCSTKLIPLGLIKTRYRKHPLPILMT